MVTFFVLLPFNIRSKLLGSRFLTGVAAENPLALATDSTILRYQPLDVPDFIHGAMAPSNSDKS
jgi:hypothetical protein